MSLRTQELHSAAVFPVIFDDSVESSVVGELGVSDSHGEGVLSKADLRAALLSMSGYGKPQYPDSKSKLHALLEPRLTSCSKHRTVMV